MANRKHQYIPPASIVDVPGVRVESNLLQDVYRGTKEQLVATGLAPQKLFPGEPGMPLASVTLWPCGTARDSGYQVPGRLCLSRNQSGMFTAALMVSKAEQERRIAEENARLAQRLAEGEKARDAERRAKAAQSARDELSRMFTTEAAFRAYLVSSLRLTISAVIGGAATPYSWHAYSIDESSRDDIFASFDAVASAIAAANVRFDPELHRKIVQDHRAKIAAGDAAFQAAVADLISAAPEVQDGGPQ